MPSTVGDRTRLRVASFLAPRLAHVYAEATERAGELLGLGSDLTVGTDVQALARGELDLAFLCGLPYTQLRDEGVDVDALAAPVFARDRYAARPVYFSDLVVRREETAGSLAELAGRRFAYNELGSHSGYNAIAAELVRRGHAEPFFGSTLPTGGHEASLRAVIDGEADVAAIDSHVIDVGTAEEGEWAEGLRVVAAVGPSPAPPLVAGTSLTASERERLRSGMTSTRSQSPAVEGWVAVRDEDYDPIREMRASARTRVGL